MKKFLSIVLALAMLALCCLPVAAAEETCNHPVLTKIDEAGPYYFDEGGCELTEYYIRYYTCECGYETSDIQITNTAYHHLDLVYDYESCDGMMHHVHYDCEACGGTYDDASWCPIGALCSYNN